MTFEYECFLLHAVPYLAEPRRAAVKVWLDKLGAEQWEVIWIGPQKDNEAGLAVWAKRGTRTLEASLRAALIDAGSSLYTIANTYCHVDGLSKYAEDANGRVNLALLGIGVIPDPESVFPRPKTEEGPR